MDKRTVLVTGGSRGIGKAIVLHFAKLGYNVSACGRNQESLDTLSKEIAAVGVPNLLLTCDVRNKVEVKSFIESVVERFGGVDILVNNAGAFYPGKIQDETDDYFEIMMETNLNASYYFSKLCIPYLKKSPKAHLFNICSTASITPYKNGGSYCISKYAQYGLTKVLREELKEDNIKVTAVLPGATRTDSWEGTDLPDSRFLNVNSIAELIVHAYQLPAEAVLEELLIRPMLGDID